MNTPYYEDDLVTLYHGDCRELTEWLAADVLVTDPPYGIGYSMHGGGTAMDRRGQVPKKRVRNKTPGIFNDHDTSARDDALELWGAGRPALVFGAWASPFPPNKQVLVWRKGIDAGVIGSVTGYRRDTELIFLCGTWPHAAAQWSSVLTTDAGINSYIKGHPHAKPTGLMERLIGHCPSGIVADPFAGSGSTLAAAKHLGRRTIGVEVDEKYCEMAARRLTQDTLFGGVA